jgi:hypothetical protein
MIGQEIKEEQKIVKKDVTPKKVEPEQTPEQKYQELANGFVQHIQSGGDWKEYIAKNANVEEAISLTEFYVSNVVQKQMLENFRIQVLRMYGLI